MDYFFLSLAYLHHFSFKYHLLYYSWITSFSKVLLYNLNSIHWLDISWLGLELKGRRRGCIVIALIIGTNHIGLVNNSNRGLPIYEINLLASHLQYNLYNQCQWDIRSFSFKLNDRLYFYSLSMRQHPTCYCSAPTYSIPFPKWGSYVIILSLVCRISGLPIVGYL